MDQDPGLTEKAKKILTNIEKTYGCVPLVSSILSKRLKYFIPSFAPPVFNAKTCYLIALAAQNVERCMRAQMADTVRFGATEDKIFETFEITSYMCMTCLQSYSFRVFSEQFGKGMGKS